MAKLKNVEEQNNNVNTKAPGGGHMGGRMGAKVQQKPKHFKKSLKQLVSYLKPYWFGIIASLVFAACAVVFDIIGPKRLAKITEEIIKGMLPNSQTDFTVITRIGVSLIILFVISAILNFIQKLIMSKISATISKNLRTEISEKINKLPLKYYDKHEYGDILSRITNDVDTLSNTLKQSLATFIYSFTSVVGMLAMMFSISWQLTLVAIVTIPISLMSVSVIIAFSQKHFIKQQKSLGDINGMIEEVYSNHNVVKVYNAEEKLFHKFDGINKDLYNSAYKSSFYSSLMRPIMAFIGNLSYVVIILIGAKMSLQDPLFLALLLAFIQYIRRFNQPVAQLASVFGTLQSTVASSERIFDFLYQTEESLEKDLDTEFTVSGGDVEFKNVKFGYDEDKIIIHNFSLKVKAGQKVAIVGPTGAGKTTIINLLMKFYELNDGEILIDGKKMSKLSRGAVRKQFAMVLQDTWLFEGSIIDNLKFSNNNATRDQIIEACKQAEVDHFIRTLPQGYDMVLSDETMISQGQKQLLTIARAMLQNAPMLILDEATSSVDTRTEILIQKAMDKLMKGKTSFIIAHRLSTIKNADIILVLNEGNIIEQGNHNNLMKKQGFYYDLYNSQFAKDYKEELA